MRQVNCWKHACIEVPCGLITVFFNMQGIYGLLLGQYEHALEENRPESKEENLPWPDLEEELQGYFTGKPIEGAYPLLTEGYPPWTLKILRLVQAIPFGETRSYKELAVEAGSPAGARAVGQALARNRTPILIPCHRVVGKGGALTGFSCGLDRKRTLLRIEGNSAGRG